MDTQTTDTTQTQTPATPAQPKPPALFGLDVPYTAPVKVVAGKGLEAAVHVIKAAGAEGITTAKLADTMAILPASADNYTRKLGLYGLVSKRLLPHAGKGAAPMAYSWIPGREIDLLSQDDVWDAQVKEALAKKRSKREEGEAKRAEAQAKRVAFNRTQGDAIKALKAAANEKVKAAREQAKKEMAEQVAALVAATAPAVAAPLPTLELVSQPGSVSAQAAEAAAPVVPVVNGAPKAKGGLPPKGKK